MRFEEQAGAFAYRARENDYVFWGFDVSRCVTVPLHAGVGAWRVH
jgi:hypothetical protein